VTLPEALRAALDVLHAEKRDVFLSCEEREYRLSPSVDACTAHPRGYQIWLHVKDGDAWCSWDHVNNFEVGDVLRDDWSARTTKYPPESAAVPRISLVVQRPDGSRSVHVVRGDAVRPPILEAAEDLVQTITTGERPPPKGLYELCARAFGTTRDDAKLRIVGAIYGLQSARVAHDLQIARAVYDMNRATHDQGSEPHLIGGTWKAHLIQLHDDVGAGRWIRVSKTLSRMLSIAVDEMRTKYT
jgi:hypothetical protein